MTNKIFIKPKNGLTVLKPDHTPLKVEGVEVAASAYWLRRIKDGEVLVIKPVKKDK